MPSTNIAGVIPNRFNSTHTPATATQATTSQSAVAGVRHVARAVYASLACGATAQTPIQVHLRDGASGAGTILWSATVAAPANGSVNVAAEDLNIPGTANTAMTLEFSAAGAVATQETVTLVGYNVPSDA